MVFNYTTKRLINYGTKDFELSGEREWNTKTYCYPWKAKLGS